MTTLVRCILPEWASKNSNLPKVVEGEFTNEKIHDLNFAGYNIYYLPNHPSIYDASRTVDGADIDVFRYVFIDMDLKSGDYQSKNEFLAKLADFPIDPTRIVDSGNGIHAYWSVSDLDGMNFLRIQRRLCRFFNTDEAVSKIFQLMRLPKTINTKKEETPVECVEIYTTEAKYTMEEFDRVLPKISLTDEQYCKTHYNRTYGLEEEKSVKLDDKMPLKWDKLVKENAEVKAIWSEPASDRSKGDFRLGHIMYAQGFNKDEAMAVLVNSPKALGRGPSHRISYAQNIIDKIWTFEESSNDLVLSLSKSVKDILQMPPDAIKGARISCASYLDNTDRGFRLGDVIGLVAGSGVGKTALSLNMFYEFVHNNPNLDHFFISLEQPEREIAERWKTLCGDRVQMYSRVHVISNYDDEGNFRHLSLHEIEEYLVKFQKVTGRHAGCVVIDHIGVLKVQNKNGENEGLMGICKAMKAFAIRTNTLLVMQSQAPRQKAGIGDIELDKDAAYGTVYFESYCDYLITMWQPLKRCYKDGAPTITAFKFCKIRHKNQKVDVIKEDVCYKLLFDSETQRLRELKETEEKSFSFHLNNATNKRKKDKSTELVEYVSAKTSPVEGETTNGKSNFGEKPKPAQGSSRVH